MCEEVLGKSFHVPVIAALPILKCRPITEDPRRAEWFEQHDQGVKISTVAKVTKYRDSK